MVATNNGLKSTGTFFFFNSFRDQIWSYPCIDIFYKLNCQFLNNKKIVHQIPKFRTLSAIEFKSNQSSWFWEFLNLPQYLTNRFGFRWPKVPFEDLQISILAKTQFALTTVTRSWTTLIIFLYHLYKQEV